MNFLNRSSEYSFSPLPADLPIDHAAIAGRIFRRRVLGGLAFGLALSFGGAPVFAQANAVIHIFNNPAVQGRTPVSALVQDADGIFYGLTSGGGASDRGTVYRIRPDGSD